LKITFLGAVQEVTGSKFLIQNNKTKILVDCGLFQGSKKLTTHNWDTFPIEPSSIDAIILTHAHIDHTGYIPLLVKNGFTGKIYCSQATYALCAILLLDSGHLHEERAKKNKKIGRPHGYPLYTVIDADYSLQFFQTVDYDKVMSIGKNVTFTLTRSGHILGSAFITLSDGKKTITFSGDIGRPNQLILKSPPHIKQTDFLVLESTYGNKLHAENDPITFLGKIVNETVAKGGTLIIPAFAVGRTQIILYCLYQLKKNKSIADIPIFLDSPMAIRVTNLFCNYRNEYKLSPQLCEDIFNVATYTSTPADSKHLYRIKEPLIIIAGSGMATGGRMLEHLKNFVSNAKNTILFVGFQVKGSYGRELINGTKKIKIDNQWYKVHAEIRSIKSLSAHADYNEILQWLGYFESPPKKVFITHGEIEASRALKKKIEKHFGWSVVIPKYLESFDLK